MATQNTDYDAAQALLDLQGNVKQENPGPHYMWRASNGKEDMEKTAKLFWNCFISSEIPVVSVSNPNCHETITMSQDRHNTENSKTLKNFERYSSNEVKSRLTHANDSKYYTGFNPKKPKTKDSSSIKKSVQNKPEFDMVEKCSRKYITKTREIATQTEESCYNPNIEFMENTIKNLCERIQSLEAQLKQPNLPDQDSAIVTSETEDNQTFAGQQSMDCNKSNIDEISTSSCKIVEFSKRIQFDDSKEFRQDKSHVFNDKVITNHNSLPKTSDLVPIGDGHAVVPARLLKHINWNSYTSATRKLLTAVFSRSIPTGKEEEYIFLNNGEPPTSADTILGHAFRILATHSLTGKPSPAFPNKPAKKRLNPALVSDIVQTVVERCSVPENVVRTSITTKCADESKMLKTRQSNKRRTSKKNCENIPPTTSESETDSGDY